MDFPSSPCTQCRNALEQKLAHPTINRLTPKKYIRIHIKGTVPILFFTLIQYTTILALLETAPEQHRHQDKQDNENNQLRPKDHFVDTRNWVLRVDLALQLN